MPADTPTTNVPDMELRTFLAERYGAGTSQAIARRDSEAARVAAIQLSAEGRPVTLLGSLLVPRDETVFSLFGAASPGDVAEVGQRTNQPYDRISEGLPITRRASHATFERSHS